MRAPGVPIWERDSGKDPSRVPDLVKGLYRFHFDFEVEVVARGVESFVGSKLVGRSLELKKTVLVSGVSRSGSRVMVEVDIKENPIPFLAIGGGLIVLMGVGWFFLDKVERVVIRSPIGLMILGVGGLLAVRALT